MAAVFAAMTTATAGAADEASPFAATAPYVSAGAVYAVEQNDSDLRSGITAQPDYGDLKNSGGYDLRLGYGFAKMFAAEVEWQSLVNFNTDALDPVTGNSAPSVEARMLSLNGRISPLTGRFQPYALFGVGWYNVQADRQSVSVHESSFASRFGLGIAAFITERMGVSFEAGYILPMTGVIGGKDRFDLIPMTLSVFFKFK